MRSKSQQRAGNGNSSKILLPLNKQHSPQKTQSNLPHHQSQEVLSKKLGFDLSTPTVDFSGLHIASRVKPDLRRLAYERFIYDFVIFETPNRASDVLSDALWDFIPYLYERSPEHSCLATVVNAVAYANFANRCNAPQTHVLAEECLGKGMKLLQTAISDKDFALSDEALCAVYLMGIYDNLSVPALNRAFAAHSGGADALLQLRPINKFYNNPISAHLCEMIFWQQLIGNLQAATSTPLLVRNVAAAQQYLASIHGASGIGIIQLIHSEVKLHAEWHKIKHNSISPASRLDLLELLQTALSLDAEFQTWESTIPQSWRYQITRNTPDTRSIHDLKWQTLILGSRGAPEEIYSYTTLKLCWIWMFYRTSRIFLLRDLLEILNWMFKLPKPTPMHSAQEKSARTALDDVRLQIHHSVATALLVKTVKKSCSAVLGAFTVPVYGKSSQDVVGMRGYTLMWSLGVMDALLKAGLIPDSGAPPSPLTSSETSVYQKYAWTQAASSYPQIHNTTVSSSSLLSVLPRTMSPPDHRGSVIATRSNEFSSLPKLQSKGTRMEAPQISHKGPILSLATDPAMDGKQHVFDSSPRHPFDFPTDLPTLDVRITECGKIDVTARREWINRILYYMATELGIKKAITIPVTEGYLSLCES